MINLYGGEGDVTIAGFTLELEKGITLQGTVDKNAETTWQNGSMSKVFHYRGMVYVWGNATLVMKAGSKITGHFYSAAKYIEFSIIKTRANSSNKERNNPYMVVIEAGAQITGNKLAALPETPSLTQGYASIIYAADTKLPSISISKYAVIDNNVQSESDNVNNIIYFNYTTNPTTYPRLSIKTNTLESDLIFPVVE